MKTIYKYKLPVDDVSQVKMPRDAVILSVQAQHSEICVWAVVDPDSPMEPVRFRVVGTGHPVPDDLLCGWTYVDTTQMHNGQLVWHIFTDADERQIAR